MENYLGENSSARRRDGGSRDDISKRVPQITVTRDVYLYSYEFEVEDPFKMQIISEDREPNETRYFLRAEQRLSTRTPVGYVIRCVKVHAHLPENHPLFISPGVELSPRSPGRINARRNEFELFLPPPPPPPLTFERYLKSCNCRAQPPASDKSLGVSRINSPGVKNVVPDLLHAAREHCIALIKRTATVKCLRTRVTIERVTGNSRYTRTTSYQFRVVYTNAK